MVSKGADVNLSNDHGNTALHYLCFYRYIDIIGYLLKESPLYVNILNKYGKSPLDKCNTEFKKRVLKLLPGPLGNAIFAKRRSFTEVKESVIFLTANFRLKTKAKRNFWLKVKDQTLAR